MRIGAKLGDVARGPMRTRDPLSPDRAADPGGLSAVALLASIVGEVADSGAVDHTVSNQAVPACQYPCKDLRDEQPEQDQHRDLPVTGRLAERPGEQWTECRDHVST